MNKKWFQMNRKPILVIHINYKENKNKNSYKNITITKSNKI
jgi:hypothetical protein